MSAAESSVEPMSVAQPDRLLPSGEPFAALGLEQAECVIAAVSGGSDSMAMLLLLADFLGTLTPQPRLLAVTIDHALRPESTDEASEVGRICAAHGIRHQTLRWDDDKPAHGIAAAARDARYRLLLQAADKAGANIIVTGHTRDDQLETFLMRRQRNAGMDARGLAAMARLCLLEGKVFLARPFLATTRQALRDELLRRNLSWFEDPSNVNQAYERPRLRLELAGTADQAQLLGEIDTARQQRESNNAAIADLLTAGQLIRIEPSGLAALDASGFAGLSPALQHLLLGLLIAVQGGRRFMPGARELDRLRQFLTTDGAERTTLAGVLVQKARRDGLHWLGRERRNLARAALPAGRSVIWDGRFVLTNQAEQDLRVGAPNAGELSEFLQSHGLKPEPRIRQSLMSGPAIYAAEELIGLPLLNGAAGTAPVAMDWHIALFDHWLTGHDFKLARALAATLPGKWQKLEILADKNSR